MKFPENSDIVENLIAVRSEIDVMEIENAKSSIFRSNCRFAKEGEKCSKFFMSLEKARYLEKNMKCVMLDGGQCSFNQKTILDEQVRFYKELYSSDADIHFALSPEKTERVLNDMERSFCDEEIKKDELFDAVMTLKSDKVPGIDGLTVEFYRKFWKELVVPLTDMYYCSHRNGMLPSSVREGLLSLLPKRGKDTRMVKNKRPLMLLCNDLKILSKAIDNRLRTILPSLISDSQSGFVKGRKISHNVRKSLDIIEHCKNNNIPGIILSIDMEKCLDRLEHSAIMGSLRYFNFGENIISWIKLLYTNFRICTQNFGILSEFWIKRRGTNQGDPLSPSLYLLTAEIMANKLRNAKVKGIQVGELEYLLSQFADDTDLYLSYDQDNINKVFAVLTGVEQKHRS